ncbi:MULTISPECIES: glycosyltransferase family 2 protein [unclassified Leifsonia]|uniref:glycosyltransferase family 2 protein n=1 Tax=unclassified Leifsonia TaxID=2663824 RepID=UPI0006FEB689|nr:MULTISPECIES: glycosyltransferase [unclassified Leifsonia]KQX08405.1 glycosyltransferase [Leifsonia sp. Root1293]KRA12687.1 glycosyltransferase [Leifsonia sp. Root60]
MIAPGTRLGAVPGNRWDLLDGQHAASPASVSVIVAHYEQPTQLARTLRAVARQRYPADLVEVIVVDDGSASQPHVPFGVRLLRQADEGFRLAAARNLGAASATNDLLVFLDADTAPEPDYLREITRLPSLAWDAVVVGRRRHADFADASTDDDVESVGPKNELTEPVWLREGYAASGNLLTADFRSYRHVIGAVIGCSRRFFDETGGFDESFTSYGGEDWEWAYRAWLHGALLAHVPSAVAWHDGPDHAGRHDSDLMKKNAETLTLAELIPVPGSRPVGAPTARPDIAIVTTGLGGCTDAQRFVSIDSLLAELPSAAPLPDGVELGAGLWDRVRIRIIVEQPVRVLRGSLRPAMAALENENCAEVVVRDLSRTVVLRVVSTRHLRRRMRWGDDSQLPTVNLTTEGIELLKEEVDLEAYLGGW